MTRWRTIAVLLLGIAIGVLLYITGATSSSRLQVRAAASGVWALTSWQRQPVVEQQSVSALCTPGTEGCVTNPTLTTPTPCVWDSDDTENVSFGGTLEPGESQSITRCLIADWNEHLSWIRSDTAGMLVTLQVGGTFVDGVTTACILGPDYDHETTQLPPVDGSNGGVGLVTAVTFTVTNNGRHRIRNGHAYGYLGLDFGQNTGCTLGPRSGFDPAWQVGSG